MKRVLVYVFYPSTFNVMLRGARLLSESGRYEPIIFFDQIAPTAAQLASCRALGIRCLSPSGEPIESVAEAAAPAWQAGAISLAGRVRRVLGPLKDALPKVGRELVELPLEGARLVRHFRLLRGQLAFARALIARERIDALLLPGESVGYGTPALVAAARELHLPSVVIPFCFASPSDLAVDLHRDWSLDLARWGNRLLGRLYPQWRFDYEGKSLVRLAASHALPMEWLGLAPPQPWVLHSGRADRVCVENSYTLDVYLRTGLPRERLVETGALSDDVAGRALGDARARREALYAELGLPAGRPMVLFSLYDFSYLFTRVQPGEFTSNAELNRFWLDSLQAIPGWNLVVSPHPFTPPEQLQGVTAAISRRPIEELIALCDLYVVCASATTRTAVACGKPVIDHDVFAFRYGHWREAPGVLVVEKRADFLAALERATGDAAYYETLAAAQQRLAARFGRMDGRAGERTLGVIDNLLGATHE
jgi:hypothetical protein